MIREAGHEEGEIHILLYSCEALCWQQINKTNIIFLCGSNVRLKKNHDQLNQSQLCPTQVDRAIVQLRFSSPTFWSHSVGQHFDTGWIYNQSYASLRKDQILKVLQSPTIFCEDKIPQCYIFQKTNSRFTSIVSSLLLNLV